MVTLDQLPERFVDIGVQWNQPHEEFQWMRLLFPGVTHPQAKFDYPPGGILSELVRTVVFEDAPIGGLELVTFPGRYHQEYLLRPIPEPDQLTGSDRQRTRALRSSVPDRTRTTQLESDGVSTIVASFVGQARAALIDRIGIEVVRPNFDPVGGTPMLTTRLVSTTDASLEFGVDEYTSPFAEHLTALMRSDVPHLTRTVLLRSDGPSASTAGSEPETARIEQQVALAGPMFRTLYPGEEATLLDGLERHDLATAYEPSELRSNLALLAETATTTRRIGGDVRDHHGTVTVPAGAGDAASLQAARRAALAGDEYEWLLGRLTDPNPLRQAYARLGVTPTIEVPTSELTAVLGLVPNYDTKGSFTGPFLERERPLLDRVTLVRAAGGTDEDSITRTRHSPSVSTETRWPRASAELPWVAASDRDRARIAIQRLRERGETVTADFEPMAPAAFVRTTQAIDDQELVVVGTPETVSFGDLLVAADQTMATGGTIVTDTIASARRFCAVLEQPYIQANEEWTELYQQAATPWTVGAGVVLVPVEQSVRWGVSTAGELAVQVGGTVAARGTVTAPPPDPVQAVHIGVASSSGYDIRDCSGNCIDTAPSIEALAGAYKPVRLPAIPTRTTYRPGVSVFTVTDERLRRFTAGQYATVDPQASLSTMLRTFLETFTTTGEDSLSVATVTRAFKRWLHPQLPDPLPTATALETAFDEIDDEFRVRERHGLGPSYQISGLGSGDATIDGVTWRYPLLDEHPRAAHQPTPNQDALSLANRLMNEQQ